MEVRLVGTSPVDEKTPAWTDLKVTDKGQAYLVRANPDLVVQLTLLTQVIDHWHEIPYVWDGLMLDVQGNVPTRADLTDGRQVCLLDTEKHARQSDRR